MGHDLYPEQENCHSHEYWQKKATEVWIVLAWLFAVIKGVGDQDWHNLENFLYADPFLFGDKGFLRKKRVDECLKAYFTAGAAECLYRDESNIGNFIKLFSTNYEPSTELSLQDTMSQLFAISRNYHIFHSVLEDIPCEFESEVDFNSISLTQMTMVWILRFFTKGNDYKKTANINFGRTKKAKQDQRELIKFFYKVPINNINDLEI